jgi:hypothetical protein
MNYRIYQMSIIHNIGQQFTSNLNNYKIDFCVDFMLFINLIANKRA